MKKPIVFVLTIALLLILSTTMMVGARTVIRFGHFAPPEQPLEIGAQALAERLAERTNGEIEMRTFPASQLGSIAEQLEQLQEGSLNMMYSNASYVGELLTSFAVYDAPFVFDDIDHVREVSRSDLVQEMAKILLETRGIRILDASPIFGPRHLSTKSTPVRHPSNLEGLNIRVHEAQTRVDMIRAWGANPVVTPTAEMYLSMQTGLADGQESPASWQADNNYWEVQGYVMHTSHFIQNEMILINERFFQSLSPEIQAILKEEAIKTADHVTALYQEKNEEALLKLQDMGMTYISDIDLDAFREATSSMWEQWENVWGAGLHDRIINRDYQVLSPEEWQNF